MDINRTKDTHSTTVNAVVIASDYIFMIIVLMSLLNLFDERVTQHMSCKKSALSNNNSTQASYNEGAITK